MLIKRRADIPSSEITPESIYLKRREFMTRSGLALTAAAMPAGLLAQDGTPLKPLTAVSATPAMSAQGFYTAEKKTPFDDVARYNNFYEFGTDKGDPARHAHALTTDPWSVQVDGEVGKPGNYALEDLLKGIDLEERIYRLRCVEAWSMVIPWVGVPLHKLLAKVEPTSKAKYVEFTTLVRPSEMRGQRSRFSTIDWPYVEGLRMDEAMHPLTLMAVGLYGKELPNQNGAPFRLVVPWKYGFKSIKSIVKIRLTEKQPGTTWQRLAPSEYGFFANVNPNVDHPRWSQKYERRLPNSLFDPNRIKTQMFNGYEEQVASLYKGMNLRRYY
ncbi:MAG: protein-methionine-sulfoxide reductase catalytic subunit MsrP [Spongiibacteraceae bacterium]|nr:protein-methionine-sulfoxide reductase catalytic subunit MsrP [Spongiibacteraceae bacterium]|tara:strand:- start:665 stop:1648 length:984 start_codon:yes stop_codon:yes gene_type:complete